MAALWGTTPRHAPRLTATGSASPSPDFPTPLPVGEGPVRIAPLYPPIAARNVACHTVTQHAPVRAPEVGYVPSVGCAGSRRETFKRTTHPLPTVLSRKN